MPRWSAEARTAAAFLSFGGHYERPGRVVYSGPGTLRVGELDGRLTPRVIELARILSDFHPASATGNIVGCRWGKLLLGTVYFATAMVDADVADILDDARARRVLSGLVGEGLAVADALGIAVEDVDGFDPRSLRGGESESAGGASDVGRSPRVLGPQHRRPHRDLARSGRPQAPHRGGPDPGRPDRGRRARELPRPARPRDAGALPGAGGRRPSRLGEPRSPGPRVRLAAVTPSARRSSSGWPPPLTVATPIT